MTANVVSFRKYTREEILRNIEYWENHILFQEYADDFYYTNGKRDSDKESLKYWETELKKLDNPND